MSKPLVIITGASSGFGFTAAQHFSAQGYPLLLLSRNIKPMQDLDLPNTLVRSVDVSDAQAFAEAYAEAKAQFGPADLLINNAGVMLLGKMAEQSRDEWRTMLDVNIMGVLNGIDVVLKDMIAGNHGTIMNISSTAGRKTYANHAAYVATKFAVHGLSENLREEVSQHNVRVITIAPGAAETNLLTHTSFEEIKDYFKQWKEEIGGVLSAQDVVNSIYFAYSQPQNVCVREIVVAATKQAP